MFARTPWIDRQLKRDQPFLSQGWGWGIVLMLLLLLASCGGGGGGSTVNPSVISTPTPASSPPSSSSFSIQLRFADNQLSSDQRQIFQEAATLWGRLIIADLPDLSLNLPADTCLEGTAAINQVIDDLLIDIIADEFDGSGGILAGASPCVVRSSSSLPAYGIMIFDQADLDRLQDVGALDRVVLHEMAHVLGFGTIWEDLDLLIGENLADPRYVGVGGVTQYNQLGSSSTTVPVENRFGAGSSGGHWREATFQTELMTSVIDSGEDPLSRLTLGSLTDLGYTVDLNAAEAYSLPPSARVNIPAEERLPASDIILDLPRILIDTQG